MIRHKFGAKPTVSDGIRFDSKLEARYYEQIKLRKRAGEVLFSCVRCRYICQGGRSWLLISKSFGVTEAFTLWTLKGWKRPSSR